MTDQQQTEKPSHGDTRVVPWMPSAMFPTRCTVQRYNSRFEIWDIVNYAASREEADAFLAGPKVYAKFLKAKRAAQRSPGIARIGAKAVPHV